jgi:hypothetical protein
LIPGVSELREKVGCSGNFGDLSEQLSLQAMSPSASVAFEFLRIQNTSEANGMGGNGSTSLEVGPEKQLAKPRCMVSFVNALNLSRSFIFRSARAIYRLSINLSSVLELVECFS